MKAKILKLMQGIHLNDRFAKSDQQKGLPRPAPEKNNDLI